MTEQSDQPSRAIEELAAFFSGPLVAICSASLGLEAGPMRQIADSFFSVRTAFGVKGWATTAEARQQIEKVIR